MLLQGYPPVPPPVQIHMLIVEQGICVHQNNPGVSQALSSFNRVTHFA